MKTLVISPPAKIRTKRGERSALPNTVFQAPVDQKVYNAIHRINHYPLDSAIGFDMTYPPDSGLSGGWRCQSFEQLGPEC